MEAVHSGLRCDPWLLQVVSYETPSTHRFQLSTVQANEEFDEVKTSDVALKLCVGMLCKLNEKGLITPEEFDAEYNEIKLRIQYQWKVYLLGLWNNDRISIGILSEC